MPAPNRGASGARARQDNWVLDARHGQRRFYPSVGHSARVLPPAHLTLNHSGDRYYFHHGSWYRPGPVGYVVVRPPIGIFVPALPPFFTTVWVGSSLYYYANDVFYRPVVGGYTVAVPPADAVVVAEAPAPGSSDTAGPYAEGTWYYCESAGDYYPYVTECAEGWQPVPAVPPDLVAQGASVPSYPEGTWYYCEAARDYYPYVAECPQGWRPVPASAEAQPSER